MTPVKPRALVHQGVVDAAALFFDFGLLGEGEARRRVLALWEPGALVHQIAGGLILRFAHPRTVDCRRAPGLPLTLMRGVLTGAPLLSEEWDALAPLPRTIALVRDGALAAHSLTDGTRVDPASWIDVSEFTIVAAETLGAPLAPPQMVAPPAEFDPRTQLAGIPAASSDMVSMLMKIREASEARHGAGTGSPASEAITTWLRNYMRAYANLLGAGGASSGMNGRGVSSEGGRRTRDGGAIGSGLTKSTPAWLTGLAYQLLNVTRLGQVFGMRQAQYIARMMRMFEQGDFAEALRHALPLAGADAAPTPQWPTLGLPGRRDDLSIRPGMGAAGGSIGFGPNVYQRLQQMYRQAFARLEAAGRIDEAAFVLAELLKANEEAVAFLERHGRMRLAAEMAEARDLPPGLIVRQWFLAGDAERAAAVARRTGAFADAVTRMERTNKAHAQTLRMVWAGALATQGDYAAAVDVAWPVPEGRALTREWIRRVLELGGPPAARMLVRSLTLEPESFADIRERAIALLADDAPESAAAHLAFAESLQKEPRTPASAALARAAVRALAADAAQGRLTITAIQQAKLAVFAGDGALKADLPPLIQVARPTLAEQATAIEIVIDAADTGALPVLDAAWLPSGRCLAALGEAGARLIARDGRAIAHLDQPAHHLVVSDHGDRAIALAPRGDAMRLARLDMLQRTARPWRDVRLDTWANTYDGSLWFVAAETDFLAIDALAGDYKALWRTPEIPGRVTHIARSAASCSFLVHETWDHDDWDYVLPTDQDLWQRWTLALPALALRARPKLPPSPMDNLDLRRAVAPGGRIADLQIELPATGDEKSSPLTVLSRYEAQGSAAPLLMGQKFFHHANKPLDIALSDDWIVAMTVDDSDVSCHVIDVKTMNIRLTLRLGGARAASARVGREHVTIGDDRGRLIVVDLRSGELVRDLRVG